MTTAQGTIGLDRLKTAATALQEGSFDFVDRLCADVLKSDPDSAEAYFLLGMAQLGRKKPSAGLDLLRRAGKLNPREHRIPAARGQAFMMQGQFSDAERAFASACELAPGEPGYLLGRADALMHLGRFVEAVPLYGLALRIDPRNADAFNNRGYALQQLGNRGEALANYCRAVVLRVPFAEALNNRGNVLQELGRREEAVKDYDAAIAARPAYAAAMSNKGNALVALGRAEEALATLKRACEVDPAYAPAHNNRGYALQSLGRHEEALPEFETALALNPNYVEALNNRAHSLQKTMRVDEALRSYETAIGLRGGVYPEAIWNRGLLKLLTGNFKAGWADIAYRWQNRAFQDDPRQPGIPEWQGQDLDGRSIRVFAEQGYGDTFQFCRFLPELVKRGARVEFASPVLAHRLLSTLSPDISLQGAGRNPAPTDYQAALFDLPGPLGVDLDTLPGVIPYLRAEPALVTKWRRRIGREGFKIGIVWQGNPAGAVDLGRSMPLAHYIPLTQIEGVRVISLQVHHGLDQLDHLPGDVKIERLKDFNTGSDAFVDTAAVMKCLDLVISTDTSPAHLAGALGVPVWTMLMHVPDWRWLLGRDDSPWYPTMRLFRQRSAGDWDGVVADIAAALRQQIAGR